MKTYFTGAKLHSSRQYCLFKRSISHVLRYKCLLLVYNSIHSPRQPGPPPTTFPHLTSPPILTSSPPPHSSPRHDISNALLQAAKDQSFSYLPSAASLVPDSSLYTLDPPIEFPRLVHPHPHLLGSPALEALQFTLYTSKAPSWHILRKLQPWPLSSV